MSLINALPRLRFVQKIYEANVRSLTSMASLKTRNCSTTTATEGKKKDADAAGTEAGLNAETEKFTKEIAELTEKNSDLLDKYKRALADGENMRMRLTKQVSEAKIFGIQSFCKDLLDVADVLSKATESVPKEELSDKNPHLKSLYEGLLMTEAQLKTVFKRHGLEVVNPLNEKFNPNYHEALFQQEVEGKESGTIVVVSKIGYKLHDRVIRPAMVGVSK